MNKARLFIATPFIALAFVLGLTFALSCLLAAFVGGKSLDNPKDIFK